MVYAGEQSRHDGQPLYDELVRALRGAGAAGATSLRGIWGYHGDHPPHGDSLLAAAPPRPGRDGDRRHARAHPRWFAIVDELTDETGLVTSEMVPAYRATGPGLALGGLRLAERR